MMYCSDVEELNDNALCLKRQMVTEVERLNRCRERNRLHAKSTRERKKSQMDCLESRIEELVDEKKRLNCTASETSVASILMSLSNIEKNDSIMWNDSKVTSIVCDSESPASTPGTGDDESDSIDIPSCGDTVAVGTQIKKEASDCYQESTKDESIFSPVELECIRREKNRMHAKQTRLRKKKMTSEMELIITNLEKEVGVLQSGLISMLSGPQPAADPDPPNLLKKDAVNSRFAEADGSPRKTVHSAKTSHLIEDTESNSVKNPNQKTTHCTLGDAAQSTVSKKRKHNLSSLEGNGSTYDLLQFRSNNNTNDRDDRERKNQWRQHISTNAGKTVSICSESAGSSSGGSGGEGGLSQGSAVHSLLHMGDTSSSQSRGTSSGSDDDSASSKQPIQTPTTHRVHVHSHRALEKCIEPLTSQPLITRPTYAYPFERSKYLQSVLAAVSPPLVAPVQKQSHWRVPERVYSFSSHTLAGPTAAAVASIYPAVFVENDNNSGPFKGYIPMRDTYEQNKVTVDTSHQGKRNQDFTIYDGHRLRAMKDH